MKCASSCGKIEATVSPTIMQILKDIVWQPDSACTNGRNSKESKYDGIPNICYV